ncbi:hypothetical protein HPB49_020182 [Dermacentor silvarum]|uniref:Uncharacterized protein n=1 Tax=Dermacentor silvarum TaxID=543639 RepID=A0ACB8C556_DERSI|nr:hypothetical protein HPB49_020182 [Dermacentor silvarum]
MEAQFAARRITADLMRYHYIVSSLPPATASEVRDLPLAPPAENTYQTLKETLIRRLTPSEPESLRQLLNHTDLGLRLRSAMERLKKMRAARRAQQTPLLKEITHLIESDDFNLA